MTEKILPIPCTKVEEKTARDWFQKINAELDELKDAVLYKLFLIEPVERLRYPRDKDTEEITEEEIAEEAADTITVITSMLEAMGIDEDMRQAAQKRVNEKNKECGRF